MKPETLFQMMDEISPDYIAEAKPKNTRTRPGHAPARTQAKTAAEDEIFEVEGCGFGAVMMRTEVLEAVANKYHTLFEPLPGFGEDLSFCMRARGCGYRIWCDPRIQAGHKAATIVTRDTFKAYSEKVGGKLT